jgi:hypothetical protein
MGTGAPIVLTFYAEVVVFPILICPVLVIHCKYATVSLLSLTNEVIDHLILDIFVKQQIVVMDLYVLIVLSCQKFFADFALNGPELYFSLKSNQLSGLVKRFGNVEISVTGLNY